MTKLKLDGHHVRDLNYFQILSWGNKLKGPKDECCWLIPGCDIFSFKDLRIKIITGTTASPSLTWISLVPQLTFLCLIRIDQQGKVWTDSIWRMKENNKNILEYKNDRNTWSILHTQTQVSHSKVQSFSTNLSSAQGLSPSFISSVNRGQYKSDWCSELIILTSCKLTAWQQGPSQRSDHSFIIFNINRKLRMNEKSPVISPNRRYRISPVEPYRAECPHWDQQLWH